MPDYERKYMGRWKMPNNDYILRSDAVEAMMTCRSLTGVAKLEAVNHIMPIPAADVEPKRNKGQWVPGDYVEYDGHGECVTYPGEGITCSLCRYSFRKKYLWSRDYCPHCGSVMLPEQSKTKEE